MSVRNVAKKADTPDFAGDEQGVTGILKPVFIIGGSRTGSEMLKTMLSASPELDFVDELFLLCPRWLHRDLRTNINRCVGDTTQEGALDRLMDLMYSGKTFGWLWSNIDTELDRELLHEELSRTGLDLRSIFLAVMLVHARLRKKSGLGAKFPLHYSYVGELLEWFPNCRIIHTTRNPKAVYASQAAKYVRDEDNLLNRAFVRSQHFAHINIQTAWTARIHRKMLGRPNYRLIRYEDVVLNPEAELQSICDFLDVEFMVDMLYPNQYGSSFDSIGRCRGIDTTSLDRWRSAISPWTARFIDTVHKSARATLGYTDPDSET